MATLNDSLMAQGRSKAYDGMAMVRRYELPQGQVLYRFVDVTRATGPRTAANGPWWFEFEAFQQIKHFALRNGYTLEYSARLFAAILYEWSEVTGVVRAQLIEPVSAWKGKAKQVTSQGKDPRDLPTATPMQSLLEVYQLFIPGFGGRASLYPQSMTFLEYLPA